MRLLIVTPIVSTFVAYVYSNPVERMSKLYSRTKRSFFSDALKDETLRLRLIIFISLYGFFVIISVILFVLFRRYRSRKLKNRTPSGNRASARNEEENRLRTISGSEESIEGIVNDSTIPAVVEPEPVLECPEELRSLPAHERLQYISYNKEFEIDKSNLKRAKLLGSGNFGAVFAGYLKKPNVEWHSVENNPLHVAIKCALTTYNPLQEKLTYDELKLMCEIGKHPNVLALVGAITPALGKIKNTLIISEFVDCGDLLKFLQQRKDTFQDKLMDSETGYLKPKSYRKKMFGKKEPLIDDSLDSLGTFDLLSFSYQIANGMEYLTRIPLVHRDLALRNILINRNKIIRIADFGLARQHKDKSYYMVRTETTQLPIYYVAPESFDTGKFSEKSDVWSFGVCLYEMFSLGDELYKGMSGEKVIEHLKNGFRMDKPQYCHKDVYEQMKLCWDINPLDRPKFTKLLRFFENHLKEFGYDLLSTIEAKLDVEAEKQRQLEEWTRKN